MSFERLFNEAEAEVGDAISRIVALTGGDPARAVRELRAWAKAGGEQRQDMLFRSTRYRIRQLPELDALAEKLELRHADFETAERAVQEVRDPREFPELSLRIDQELGAAAADAIVVWVRSECSAWVAGRLG
jgi:hypothetical protein